MKETGWQAIGRIAKERRERLGLRQDELALFGGPGVSTVGKFERAAQPSFPPRTQQQMEKALGWSRTIVEQVVTSIDEGTLSVADWEHDLIHEDIPDLAAPAQADQEESRRPYMSPVESLAYIISLVDVDQRDEAVRAALTAIFPFISTSGAVQLGKKLRQDFPPYEKGGDGHAEESRGSAPTSRDDFTLAAHDDEKKAINDENELGTDQP